MPSAKQEFNDRVDRLLREGRDLPEETIRRMIREIEAARTELLARLAGLPVKADGTASYNRFQLERVQQDLDRLIDELGRRLAGEIAAGERRAFQVGTQVVEEPFGRAGLGFTFGHLPLEQLAVLQDYSALAISNITNETRGVIDLALQRSLIGGMPFHETIQKIAGALNGEEKGPVSLWTHAGERAMRVAATEIPTVQAIASDVRIGQMADRYGKDAVEKEWRHHPVARVPREGHLLLGVAPAIPVDQRFENPETGALLRFPHDPAATNPAPKVRNWSPASENVSCSCSIAPHIVASSALDKQFEESRARALAMGLAA